MPASPPVLSPSLTRMAEALRQSADKLPAAERIGALEKGYAQLIRHLIAAGDSNADLTAKAPGLRKLLGLEKQRKER